MVQTGLSADFKYQVLQWYGAKLPMKEPRGLLVQTYLTSCEIHEVVIKTAEPVSNRESTERMKNPSKVLM